MINEEQLSNAPIKEAIIDIQIDLDSEQSDFDHQSLSAKISGEYTKQEPISEAHVAFEINTKGESVFNNKNLGITGYRAENSKSGYVAQFRKTGMTVSKLSPYENWDSFKNEAKLLWSLYKETIPDYKLSRLAVRYINEIDIPFANDSQSINFDDYLINSPRTPNDMSTVVSEFFSRVVIPYPELGTNVIVIQTLKDITNSHVIVILDTDVFRTNVAGLSETEMWDFFDQLRFLKNKVFKGSLTNKTMELFK
ncbi:MAG: TIGR04255 family protein [Gammaproteobacteria bacterium]|nr:MAG: TIGR04255 family protein [Gammaproteobacteria bacterium]